MRVLNVAFAAIPVGTAIAAGAEQVLSMLDAGLLEHGHESIVIAAFGSKVLGQLVESSAHGEAIERVLATESIDLMHFHGLDFPQYLPDSKVPMLATLHLPLSFYPEGTVEHCRSRDITLNCVSNSQAASSPLLSGLPVISNGVSTRFFVPDEAEGYILWLGRICPEKGAHIALEVAHRRDMKLIIAGPVHPYAAHQEYFSQYVEPWLDKKRCYVGPVGPEEKRKLLARADCLVVPCFAAETSSLVAMEALSCGTPVVAFRNGALPEVIDPGETGLLVDSAYEMSQAVVQARHLSRTLCRERAVERFDSRQMVERYLTLYRLMIKRRLSIGTAPHHDL